jgi:hypothetical protein
MRGQVGRYRACNEFTVIVCVQYLCVFTDFYAVIPPGHRAHCTVISDQCYQHSNMWVISCWVTCFELRCCERVSHSVGPCVESWDVYGSGRGLFMLNHESARGRRFQGLSVRNSEYLAEVLKTQMRRSACDGVWCSDAATADFFGFCTECIVWALRTRSPVIPFDHSNGTLQFHFPGSSNRTVSISWKAAYGAWEASQVCQTVRVIGLEFKNTY